MKKNKSKKIFLMIFRLLSVIIIVVCLYLLYNWHNENKQNNELISDIRSQIDISDNSNGDSETDAQEELLDFSGLLETNSDTVAWIKVNNTDIDFPVVKCEDNNFYLKHNFKKEYNSAGWIFSDFRNKFDNTDKNIIIYGHNRRDGSMFSTLNNVTKEEWYTNPDNLTIPLYTPVSNDKYQIFSIYTIVAQNFDSRVEFESDEEFEKYLNDISSKSIYNFGVDVTSKDNILTIYTCGNNTKYRIIVHAKKINN